MGTRIINGTKYVGIAEAAFISTYSRAKVKELVKAKKLRGKMVLGRYYFVESQLREDMAKLFKIDKENNNSKSALDL